MKKAVAATACAIVAIAGLSELGAFISGGSPWPRLSAQGQAALSEANMAQSDNLKVRTAIECMCNIRSDILTNHLLPANSRSTPGPDEHSSSALTPFQVVALDYSEELKERRIKLDEEIRADRACAWWFQIGIVVFGGLATIMVGLKPLCERMRINFVNTAVAAFAIIFSATVTSLSSLSAIAAGQTDLLHHQRTLAQLQQLHWRINNDAFAATKLCDRDQENPDLSKVGSWKGRLEEITNEAMPIVAQPGDLRQGGPSPGGVRTASR
jgi:hypothetical protein